MAQRPIKLGTPRDTYRALGQLEPGTAVIVQDGSMEHGRFGLVTRHIRDSEYAVRVAQHGGGWRTRSFERSEIRVPIGGRKRRRAR